MIINHIHDWDLSYDQARQLQLDLAGRIRLTPIKKTPKTVAGLDCAFSKDMKRICAAVLVFTYPGLELIEMQNAVEDVTFPYIPGLLSFREAPVCIKAAEKLKHTPDLFLIDGQGIAHPRKMGLAAHLGLFFDKPTIGCAKSRLIGQYKEPAKEKGSFCPLIHNGETIGAVLRTRTNVKPLFISPGHKCSLDDAIEFTLACSIKYRLPEPTRQAHHVVTELKATI